MEEMVFIYWDEMWNQEEDEKEKNQNRQRRELQRERVSAANAPKNDTKTSR